MLVLIAIIALTLCGVAVAATAWGLVLPHARSVARLREIEGYGYQVAPATGGAVAFGDEPERRSPLLDLATAVGDLVSRRFGNDYLEHIRGKLVAAGLYKTDPRAIIGVQVLGAAVLGGLSVLADVGGDVKTTLMIAFAAIFISIALPYVAVHGRASRRLDKIDRALPDLIDMIVVMMEAGLGFGAAVNSASTRISGPLGDELRLTIQEHRMGLALPGALLHMLKRVDTPNVQAFVRSVTQGEQLGVSMGLIMRGLAVEMRVRRRQKAEEQGHKAPIKMLFPLIFLMFPALGVVILGPAVIEIGNALGGLGQ